jgi:hypothetical protein
MESKYKYPDYRKSEIAWKYIRRGLCTVGRHGLAVFLLPVAASLVVRHQIEELQQDNQQRR